VRPADGPPDLFSAERRAPILARELSVFSSLLFAQIFLGVFPVIGKIALATIPPLPFALFRVAGASALLTIFARLRPRETVAPEDRRRFWLLSFIGVSVNQIFFITGLFLSTAINAAILMTTIPALTLFFAILTGRESFAARKIAGCLLALAGALVLLGAGRFDARSDLFLGDLLLMINAACYSLYLVLSRDLLKKYTAATFIRVTFSMGTLPVLAFAAVPLARMSFRRVTLLAWVCLAAVIVFASALAYGLNAWALARTHASRVAIFVTLQPVVATALAIVWLGEVPTPKTAVSAGLIFAGVLLSRPPFSGRRA
jgi:drug/metabolite transporter (DMT)-like permease